MKKLLYILFACVAVFSCTPQNKVAKNPDSELKPQKNDEGEWELNVFDIDYDYFLTSRAKPMSMYSESYLKSKNAFLVNEWNSLYYSGKYRNIVENTIDYDPNENYGLKFEYRLYQVFAYAQWKYGLRLNGLIGESGLR